MTSVYATAWVVTAVFLSSIATTSDINWELVVRPAQVEVGRSTRYWVGIRNITQSQRALCRVGVNYIYDLPDGGQVSEPSREYPTSGSFHSCGVSGGHLVLPGETYFVKVEVSQPQGARAPVRFSVKAEEACAYEGMCTPQEFSLVQDPR